MQHNSLWIPQIETDQRFGVAEHVVLKKLMQLIEAVMMHQRVDDQLIQIMLPKKQINMQCENKTTLQNQSLGFHILEKIFGQRGVYGYA